MESQKDGLLEHLVSMMNDQEISMSITLTVGGVVVTGMLIGFSEYFDRMSELFTSNASQPDGWKKFFEVCKEAGRAKQEETKDPAESESFTPVKFIHLKDAHYVVGGAKELDRPGVLWRGLLSEVDGFSPGEIVLERKRLL